LLPFPRNESFVGREKQLQSLEELIVAPNTTHQRMTICGLGGCGKSALALEFAYRALARHARYLVFWVPAISQETFELAYRDIGTLLRIPGIADDNADVKLLVKRALDSESFGDWLMIVDNADDPSVLLDSTDGDPRSARLSDRLPRSSRGTILFTTRSKKAAEDLTQAKVIRLSDMDQAEAKLLLTQRLAEVSTHEEAEEDAKTDLVRLLAYLPLAIVQAAAFISSDEISVSEYIALFKQSMGVELLSEHFEDPSRYREMESTIAKTWYITFDQILKQDRLAADYLAFMACIDRVNIPQSLLPSGDSQLQQTKALGTLKAYAFLIERRQILPGERTERFFDIHRLVHTASIRWLKEHGEWMARIDIAVARLEEVVPYGGHEKKEAWTTYLPHANHVATSDNGVIERTKASLLNRVGRCQSTLGQYPAAEATHRQVLSIRGKSFGKQHQLTLSTMNAVGEALSYQGRHEAAEVMHRQTLAAREKVLGTEHPDTLLSKNNLALVLDKQGKYEAAEVMHRQTLAASEKVLGTEHPDTLLSKNNLALVLDKQGKYEAAEVMHRQTLAASEKVLGIEHPDTLMSKNNLAGVLDRQGKYEAAEVMHRETLRAREMVLWKEHPDTLTSINNLAVVLDRQGKYEAAEIMYRQMLAASENVLGKEHPSTLISMNNLAQVLVNQGKYEAAETIHRKSLAGKERVLGKEHPSTLISMNNLAGVLVKQSKYEVAEVMHGQALAVQEKVLGKEHPDTLLSVNNLADLFATQHCYAEADALYQRACAGYSTVLGHDHPTTRFCRRSYSHMLAAQERNRSSISAEKPFTIGGVFATSPG
jgi:tetratricopeptide (TPR) repeat protein